MSSRTPRSNSKTVPTRHKTNSFPAISPTNSGGFTRSNDLATLLFKNVDIDVDSNVSNTLSNFSEQLDRKSLGHRNIRTAPAVPTLYPPALTPVLSETPQPIMPQTARPQKVARRKKPISAELPAERFACRMYFGEPIELPATNAELEFFGQLGKQSNFQSVLSQDFWEDNKETQLTRELSSVMEPTNVAVEIPAAAATVPPQIKAVGPKPTLGSYAHSKLLASNSEQHKVIYRLRQTLDHVHTQVNEKRRDCLICLSYS
jgi:hypothetical protein